ncbi:hypothetical protein FOZ63_012640, partial [Perkinsus olseni]
TWYQIRRVWIPTFLQLLLLVFWALEASLHFIRGNVGGNYSTMTWLYISIMLTVGLMGGASYSNCMFLFQRREDIPNTHRELCVNLGFAASNLGILLASLASLLMANTLMKDIGRGFMASGGYYPSGMSVPDLSVFRSTYHFMTDPEVPERSDYPPGYSGHQPKTKFLFGYGSPTASRSTTVVRGHQVLEAAPALPTGSWMCKPPLQRAQIPRPVTAPDGPSGQPEARPQQQQRQERR